MLETAEASTSHTSESLCINILQLISFAQAMAFLHLQGTELISLKARMQPRVFLREVFFFSLLSLPYKTNICSKFSAHSLSKLSEFSDVFQGKQFNLKLAYNPPAQKSKNARLFIKNKESVNTGILKENKCIKDN